MQYHSVRFLGLAVGTLAFSTAYTLLQERVYRMPGFKSSGCLTLVTFTIYAICGLCEMIMFGLHRQRQGSLTMYALVALLAVTAMYLTNWGLTMVSYTMKIVTKSSRVLPVMALSTVMQSKRYSPQEYGSAFFMILGLVLFMGVDVHGAEAHPAAAFGFCLIVLGLLCEALLSNLEEKFFFRGGVVVSRQEVMTYMSAFAALYAGAMVVATGEMAEVRQYDWRHTDLWVTIVLSALAGYGAMSVILRMIDCFGVTITEVIKSIRKVMQVSLSFFVFQKPLSSGHVVGGVLTVIALYGFLTAPRQLQQQPPPPPPLPASGDKAAAREQQLLAKMRQSPRCAPTAKSPTAPLTKYRPFEGGLVSIRPISSAALDRDLSMDVETGLSVAGRHHSAMASVQLR